MTVSLPLTCQGITQPITEWALDYGIYPNVITDRLARGWTAERAITTPMVVAPQQRLLADYLPNLPALQRRKTVQRRKRGQPSNPGVALNLPALSGTGGGSTAQDIPEIEILT